jgi:hypothetical protein
MQHKFFFLLPLTVFVFNCLYVKLTKQIYEKMKLIMKLEIHNLGYYIHSTIT